MSFKDRVRGWKAAVPREASTPTSPPQPSEEVMCKVTFRFIVGKCQCFMLSPEYQMIKQLNKFSSNMNVVVPELQHFLHPSVDDEGQ